MFKKVTKNILIVDNTGLSFRAIKKALMAETNLKYGVHSCNTAKKALAYTKSLDFDLVILNSTLPDINASKLLKKIKKQKPDINSILIIEPDFIEKEFPGFDAFLCVGHSPLDIIVTVQKVFENQSSGLKFSLNVSTVENLKQRREILILEDDSGLSRIYRKALEKYGYSVDIASTINQGRGYLIQKEYDLFICDIHLGRQRGTDLILEQQEQLNKANTKIIIASSYHQYRSMTEEIGAEFFLEKPISISTLVTMVDRIINSKNNDESNLSIFKQNNHVKRSSTANV